MSITSNIPSITPSVSVIVPNFNHAAYLDERLSSIFNQTFASFEVILLDDASTDNSRAIIERYRSNDQVTHIQFNEKNTGSTFEQWKKGISLARGEFIWLAESDDVAEPGFLEECVFRIQQDPAIVLTYSNSAIINESGAQTEPDLQSWYTDVDPERWKHDFVNDGLQEIADFLWQKNTIPNASAVLFRKSSFETVTGFRFAGDWLTWIKILQKGKVSFSATVLNRFRMHSETTRHKPSTPQRFRQFLKERFAVLDYLLSNHLVEKQAVQLQIEELQQGWLNAYKLGDVFSPSFFVPFNDGRLYAKFFLNKTQRAIRRLKPTKLNAR